jgi:hypothetical protein
MYIPSKKYKFCILQSTTLGSDFQVSTSNLDKQSAVKCNEMTTGMGNTWVEGFIHTCTLSYTKFRLKNKHGFTLQKLTKIARVITHKLQIQLPSSIPAPLITICKTISSTKPETLIPCSNFPSRQRNVSPFQVHFSTNNGSLQDQGSSSRTVSTLATERQLSSFTWKL